MFFFFLSVADNSNEIDRDTLSRSNFFTSQFSLIRRNKSESLDTCVCSNKKKSEKLFL